MTHLMLDLFTPNRESSIDSLYKSISKIAFNQRHIVAKFATKISQIFLYSPKVLLKNQTKLSPNRHPIIKFNR
ncbi:hypothetical protein BpHYR1_004208 [Brachionus plicatilis]|uniref:Uncharacterized protein n=1 Tax=Brachionus plicatilis TaxID=10195 RepID=A0A3M7R1Z8_BRAPC|nr:hypothetical protein BpHYR1_004208 [Brachionus plicatilis]